MHDDLCGLKIRGHYFRYIGCPEDQSLQSYHEISPETVIPNPISTLP
jgi:hypothetical protein